MRPRGRCFNGSDSMLKTQKDLEKLAGNAVWFTEFTPVRIDHLDFVKRLLLTFCELDICCTIINSYPAYVAGAVGVCSTGKLALGVFYFAKVNSPLLDNFTLAILTLRLVLSRLPYASPWSMTKTLITMCIKLRWARRLIHVYWGLLTPSPSLADPLLALILRNSYGTIR